MSHNGLVLLMQDDAHTHLPANCFQSLFHSCQGASKTQRHSSAVANAGKKRKDSVDFYVKYGLLMFCEKEMNASYFPDLTNEPCLSC